NIIDKVTRERDAFQARVSGLEDQNANLQSTIQAHQQLLAQKQEQISKLNESVKQKELRLSDLSQTLTQTQNHYARDVAWLQSVVADKENRIAGLSTQAAALSTEVATIHISHAWKAVNFYYRVRDRILP